MKFETILGAVTKVASAGGGSIAFLTLSPMAWAGAFIGAMLSFYFQPEKTPKEVRQRLYGILAMAFAGAMLSAAVPFVPLFTWSRDIPQEVRAGLCGLTIAVIWELWRKYSYKKVQEA